MPITHVVTLTFKAGTPQQRIAELATELGTLRRHISAIDFAHGRDMSIRDNNADYAITAMFASHDDFLEYMDFPMHQRIIRELVAPNLRSRSAVQFSTPGRRASGGAATADTVGSHAGIRR